MEQMTSICDMAGQIMQKKEEEKRIAEEQAAKDRYWKIPICYDDDEDYTIEITPVLSTEEPVDSLIIEDGHLDTIPATASDEVIKYSVEELIPIPSKPEGISDGVCDVPLCDNPTPLEAFKDHSEIVVNSNDDSSSSDDDSFSSKDIEYVDASPPDAEIVSLEVVEIVITEIGGIDDDILQQSKMKLLHEKFFDDLIPPGIDDDDDSEGDILPLEELLDDVLFLLLKSDNFTFVKPVATMENNIEELNEDESFDPGGDRNVVLPNVKEDDTFTLTIRTFLPFVTYPEDSPLLLSSESEDTIFDPGISTFHFSSLKPVAYENPMVIFLIFGTVTVNSKRWQTTQYEVTVSGAGLYQSHVEHLGTLLCSVRVLFPRSNMLTLNQKYSWLEYSVGKDSAFCYVCYLFNDKDFNEMGDDAFVRDGFKGWNRPVGFTKHVGKDTTALTLRDGIYSMLAEHSLSPSRIRGQGYDGASNMKGGINGLKTLILKETQSAYYIHCFAHQLQLTLVVVSKKSMDCSWLFETLTNLLNVVGVSCKRADMLREIQAQKVAEAFNLKERKSRKSKNQELGLGRPGDTRWGSHYKLKLNVIALYPAIREVLDKIRDMPSSTDHDKLKAEGVSFAIESFDFIFMAHLMKTMFGVANELNVALQNKTRISSMPVDQGKIAIDVKQA
ncbi:zinc finger MYM-type protein 1-like protein [Tanacetum coccineum]